MSTTATLTMMIAVLFGPLSSADEVWWTGTDGWLAPLVEVRVFAELDDVAVAEGPDDKEAGPEVFETAAIEISTTSVEEMASKRVLAGLSVSTSACTEDETTVSAWTVELTTA